jgi:hypothetical protein
LLITTACAAGLLVAATIVPARAPARAAAPPRNTAPPTIDDTTPEEGQTLTAQAGTWTGTQPFVVTYRWRRCNSTGAACVDIPGGAADNPSYEVRAADVGFTLRVRVRVSNSEGAQSATSAATSLVTATPAAGASVAVTSVSLPQRLLIDAVTFSPSPVRSRSAPITVLVRIKDTRGRLVSGALVFVRAVPLVTSTPPEGATGNDGVATFTVVPNRQFSLVFRRGFALPFFVRARKQGEDPLAGISARRLVQVRIAPAG